MQDKKTYRIDESALRENFLNYRVSFDPVCLELLENEVAQVKTHSHLELPDTKNLVRLIIISVALIVLGVGAFFTYNYIKNLPPADQAKDTVTVSKPVVVQPKKTETPVIQNKPAVSVIDSIKEEKPKTDTSLQNLSPKTKQPAKTAHNTKSANKKDTTSVKLKTPSADTIKKKAKPDTSSVIKNKDNGKKKKKKRKNILDATDDIRQSEPVKTDDDVIIPQ